MKFMMIGVDMEREFEIEYGHDFTTYDTMDMTHRRDGN